MIFRGSSDKGERLKETGGSPIQLSPSLIKENMRRFWPIPLVGFVYYFLVGIFPLMIRDVLNNVGDNWYFIEILANENPGMYLASLFLPLFAAVAVFGYMHKTASVSYMHAMPFSRARLFDTGFLSGLLMCWIPMLLTGLMLFIFAGGGDGTSAYNVFLWIAENLLVILFNYSVCALSACIAGTAVHQILLSFFLLFIAPIMWLLGQMYMELYLKGYSTQNSELARIFNPWIYMIMERHYSVRAWIFFAILTLALIVLSYVLHKERKMERAGDGLVYGFMVPVVSYIAAFLGMTMLGVYFEAMIGSESRIFGYAAGAFLGFMISRMILFKTAKVFNKRFWINFGIYALIACIFIAGLAFDAFGYGRRVPDKAEYAGINLWVAGSGYLNERYSLYDGDIKNYGDFIFKDSENIEHVKALQRDLIEWQKDADQSGKSYEVVSYDADEYSVEMPNKRDILSTYGTIDICYKLPSMVSENSRMYRHYEYVPFSFIVNNEHLKALFESEEYMETFGDSDRLGRGRGVNSVELDISGEEGYGVLNINGSDAHDFAKAMDADFANRKWEDCMELIAESTINYPGEDGTNYVHVHLISTVGAGESKSFSEVLTDRHTNALKWLEEHGYGDVLHDDPKTIKNYLAKYSQ